MLYIEFFCRLSFSHLVALALSFYHFICCYFLILFFYILFVCYFSFKRQKQLLPRPSFQCHFIWLQRKIRGDKKCLKIRTKCGKLWNFIKITFYFCCCSLVRNGKRKIKLLTRTLIFISWNLWLLKYARQEQETFFSITYFHLVVIYVNVCTHARRI